MKDDFDVSELQPGDAVPWLMHDLPMFVPNTDVGDQVGLPLSISSCPLSQVGFLEPYDIFALWVNTHGRLGTYDWLIGASESPSHALQRKPRLSTLCVVSQEVVSANHKMSRTHSLTFKSPTKSPKKKTSKSTFQSFHSNGTGSMQGLPGLTGNSSGSSWGSAETIVADIPETAHIPEIGLVQVRPREDAAAPCLLVGLYGVVRGCKGL